MGSMDNQLQTAVALLWALGLSVLTAMPLLAWLLLNHRRDAQARIWFAGMGFYALGAFVLAAQRWWDGWQTLVVGPALAVIMLLCMYEALRRDLKPGPTPWWRLLLAWCVFVAMSSICYALGVRTSWGQVLASIFWSVAEGLVFWQTLQLYRRHAGRATLVIGLAMLLGISAHVARVVFVLRYGGTFHLLDLQPVTSYFYLINIIGVTLCSFGFWGYVLEKTQRHELALQAQTMQAQTEARVAHAHAQEMQELVQQRDQMLMINSRFAAINSLAIFNSAVIHEVSQPLQAIGFCLDQAFIHVNRSGLEVMRQPLQDAQRQVAKLADLLVVMRKLVSTQGDAVESVRLSEVRAEILPVLRSEVARREVSWQENLLDLDVVVSANKVLLERLLLNLVGNALDAVSPQATRGEPAQVCFDVFRDTSAAAGRVLVVVTDNGPGIEDPDQLLNVGVFHSTKADGLGVGLAFARLIVRQWGGELIIENRAHGQRGVKATLSLPMASGS